MVVVSTDITPEIEKALKRQARALLLTRRSYLRAIIAAVVAEAEREQQADEKGGK